MCLILFSFDPTANTPLIVAANRDEFFSRPSAPAAYWDDSPQILAGRDLIGQGTWIGITTTGRFAAVTNVREPSVVVENPLSRGELTRDFLAGSESAEAYLQRIENNKMRYSGFNLLVGQVNSTCCELLYLSNRKDGIHTLKAGTYGLSNHLLDSPWPKVSQGTQYVRDQIKNTAENTDEHYHHSMRHFLENPSLADDTILPKTGVSYEREKALSAAFITLPDYGTRTSTVITMKKDSARFSEKNYEPREHSNEPAIGESIFFNV